MNAKNLIVTATLLAAAGSALAEVSVHENTYTVGSKTREQVRAELESAYAAGQYTKIVVPEAPEATAVASVRTRDEVRREAIQAAKSKQAKDNRLGG